MSRAFLVNVSTGLSNSGNETGSARILNFPKAESDCSLSENPNEVSGSC